MPMEYPQVIIAIKEWIGKNKISTDSMVKITGQAGARLATIGEMLLKFATQAVGDSFSGGPSSLPGPLGEAVKGIASQVKDILPSLPTEPGGMWDKLGSYIYQNPETFDQTRFDALVEIVGDDTIDAGVKDALTEAVLNSQPTGAWNVVMEQYNSFTDQLAGVSIPGTDGYTLKECIDLGTDKTNDFFSSVTGLTKFSVADLGSSITEPIAKQKFVEYHDALLAAAKMPESTPLEVADKKQAIVSATAGCNESAAEIQAQIEKDKANYTQALAQKTAIDTITQEGETYANIQANTGLSASEKAVYESTLQPATLANAKNVSATIDQFKPSTTVDSIA